MARAAHPDAMKPGRAVGPGGPGSTRTAPPMMPDQFPFSGRYLAYVLFDATGLIYLLLGGLALRLVWALGDGSATWEAVLATFQNPIYLAFHAVSLLCVLFVGVRFFRLFPKAQPPRIGPAKPPPQPAILGMLYVVWIGVAGGMSIILAGGIF